SIYLRVDWPWAVHNSPLVSMGWHPESGFINSDWKGYDEGMIVYILGLGSPTHPIDPAGWTAWTSTYVWMDYYGKPLVNFPPLFGHQYSHIWIDFRGIQDAYMRGKGIDYFENSRRATLTQRSYAIDNPAQWRDYGPNVWGFTAVDGPHDTTVVIDGRSRQFHTYSARGVAADYVMDDGTLAPTAPGGSVPFAPEIAIPALITMREKYGDNLFTNYGFLDSFNPTFRLPIQPHHGHVVAGVGWFDGDYLGIDQGPIIAMIENYRSDLIWKTMRRNPYVVAGLKKAGFTGGWLGN
ncbi:MAG: glucoamylase family protein, partial [Gemmatimonadaceae bacterium]